MCRHSDSISQHVFDLADRENADLCSRARALVKHGVSPLDWLVGERNGRNCIQGRVWWFAGRCVSETRKDGPRYVKWKPFQFWAGDDAQ